MSAGAVRMELRRDDAGYPQSLAQLTDPPHVLYCMGDVALLRPGLAVVGARRATPYGIQVTRRFAGWAASHGVVIISGAAIGCDQAAHRAALESGGRTVAVLGCGADVDYPSGARGLLDQLRRNHLVVSECPWGARPTRWTFVRRNRIIAALSSALLVAEAGLGSGTFTTADFALDLGREVLAVPGSILSAESAGANRLIRQGAAPITDIDELSHQLRSVGLVGDVTTEGGVCGGSRNVIERALAADPMRPDDIARTLDLDIVSVSRALSALELAGRVVRHADGRFFTCGP